MTNFAQPFKVDPIIPNILMRAHSVNVRVTLSEDGQDVHAWLDDAPKHPLTGEVIEPKTCKLALPGDRKREAFHVLDPRTNKGIALAMHPATGELIGWYTASVVHLEDVDLGDIEVGVPPEWSEE